jgi:CheY-like chemotaxis protein
MSASEGPIDVLIAEDDDQLRQSYRMLLEAHGLTCAVASSGAEAIELARARQPRCVLIDLDLPGMDGFTVARTLRADPRTRGAHIHCLSGLSDAGTRQQASSSGYELYLTRPVSAEVLLEAICPPAEGEMGQLTCASLVEAEELLDWLQNQRCTRIEVSMKDDQFTVRCICPPGLRLVRDDAGLVRLQPI